MVFCPECGDPISSVEEEKTVIVEESDVTSVGEAETAIICEMSSEKEENTVDDEPSKLQSEVGQNAVAAVAVMAIFILVF